MFERSSTILEIDDSYLGSTPSFNNYEATLKYSGVIEQAATNTDAANSPA